MAKKAGWGHLGRVENGLDFLAEDITFLGHNNSLLLHFRNKSLHQDLDITQLVKIEIPLLLQSTDRVIRLRSLTPQLF
jgi:hypothetical protein